MNADRDDGRPGSMVRLLPCGPQAVLAEYPDLAAALGVADRLRRRRLPGVIDVVPALRTVLVTHDGADLDQVAAELYDLRPLPDEPGPLVTLSVRYDGPDLEAVAAATGLSPDEVISVHSGATYRVAFCGFLPGFAYLLGLPAVLHLPRRATPRTRVPAGAVAIAAEFSAVYPAVSPGGWHLLGSVDDLLWDEQRPDPALLGPATRVRFTPQ